MKKVLSSLLIFVFAFLVFSVSSVSAKVITSKDGDITITKTEVVNDDLFIGARSVEIVGVINGDLFIGAQTVKITGVVNGNVHVGATTVDLSGTVKGNVYVGGQNILVNGSKIGGSLIVGGGTVSVDKDSIIGGSVIAGAGTLSVNSQVKRSVYAGTANLTIGSEAKIGKDLYYASGNSQGSTNISSSAKVAGNVYKSEVDTSSKSAELQNMKSKLSAFLSGLKITVSIFSFVGTLIVGFLYYKLFGKNFTESAKFVTGSFWKSMGVGFLVTIAFIPGIIILLITVVGIPVAGIAFLLLMLYFYLAKIVVGLSVGEWMAKKFKWNTSVYSAGALGLLTIYLVKMIPVVGWLVGLVVFWVGVGALTLQTLSKSE